MGVFNTGFVCSMHCVGNRDVLCHRLLQPGVQGTHRTPKNLSMPLWKEFVTGAFLSSIEPMTFDETHGSPSVAIFIT